MIVLTQSYSKSQSGIFTTGVVNFLFTPFDTVSSEAEAIYERAKTFVEKLELDAIAPGLLEQYKIQLERLRPGNNQTGPSCEVMSVAGVSTSCIALLLVTILFD